MTTKIKASNIETGAITADKLEATLDLSSKTVTLPSGGYATESYVTTQIGNVIGGAPGALDTLNELAAALGDDENFATSVTNALALKANSTDVYTQSQVDTAIANNQAVTTGTTEPSSPSIGDLWYDTTVGVTALKIYNGTEFIKVAIKFPTLTIITGSIVNTVATNLTLTGTNFLSSNLVVTFTAGGTDYDVTVTPTSDSSATVAVPSSVYNQAGGTSVTIKVTNSDGGESGALATTINALPSGGTVYSSGGYRYHKFTSSGTFTNTISNLDVDYLIVAGGGGGGWDHGGGGGAGGLRQGSSTGLSATSYSITVGGGGSAGGSPSDGGNSVFNSIASIGGGRGGGSNGGNTPNTYTPNSGGSGGGGPGYNLASLAGASGTSGQGNSGGSGRDSGSDKAGGGGGGAGASGQNAYSNNSGDGGIGLQYSTWASATSSGESGYFAGGGGAGGWSDQGDVPGTGGTGGGGNGGQYGNVVGEAGQVNTGGGGGGGDDGSGYGGAGGSGIVIIRYQL